ncbi:phage tail sheath family protein [Archangium violaceum]|uniref:Tail protein n=1 Tax=Archangium violaceum Cb vi76 TaxID=1406225 RepID=A0A084T0V1_9BACT|nr:phage tail sheath subtilisin-like domain-containing protein [Archangium violaceum]KFA94336.1 tail protein [Archangium violaceum Cb vi76]
MPEYLAPGVFVEETSFRSKSIEGVSTTTTGFIGPTRYGPVELENELITSLGEFERTYGNRQQLVFDETGERHNYLWHAVRAFFEEGGKRLYISRVFRPTKEASYTGFNLEETVNAGEKTGYPDGHSRTSLSLNPENTEETEPRPSLLFAARYPGASGNMGVRITLRVGQNILSYDGNKVLGVGALQNRDVVLINKVWEEKGERKTSDFEFDLAQKDASGEWTFTFNATVDNKPVKAERSLSSLDVSQGKKSEVHVITATVSLLPTRDSDSSLVWNGLALDPEHNNAGAADSLTARFKHEKRTPSLNREIPLIIHPLNVTDGLDLLKLLRTQIPAGALAGETKTVGDYLTDFQSSDPQRSVDILLERGHDGTLPTEDEYKGWDVPSTTRKTGLKQFEDLEDISIVAAPGSTLNYETGPGPSVVSSLISHCERMRYRIAVLDSGNNQTLQQVREMRAKFDSSHAALYYPWIKVMDPVTRQPIVLPPSGFVAGIYARNDVRRAVYKAPANEVVTTALGFESILNTAQQEALNPEGINAFRFFEGRGLRLWGARTISSDPEWKYVNLRRYFAYLERSIDKGTQWAVFEPNGPQLWANVRRSIEDFLFNEWQSGALLGDRPDAAYFVKCDRSTMTQNDLDNGRLICLVGVAPLRPAEFVIIRIGQWTGDRK